MAQSIGDQLKEAREKRGLTIEQVSQATHIRTHYLEALENDQREALPSSVQGRGFLRLYADHLGLPVADLLAAWDGNPLSQPIVLPSAFAVESEPPAAEPASAEPASLEINPVAASTTSTSEEPASTEPGSSLAIFREIGQMVQKQREALGLSRLEVERFTRLRQHYIQALESGDIEQLPSPVQGRGMLSNYLNFLNMDEEKVLLRFAEGLQARRVERLPKPEPGASIAKKRPARQAPLWRRFLTPDLLFGVAVAGVILFSALWTAARISSARNKQVEPTPPDVAGVLLTPKANRTGTLAAALTPAGTVVAAVTAETLAATPTVTPVNDPNQELTPVEETRTPSGGGQANTQNRLVTWTPAAMVLPSIVPINSDPLQVYIVAHKRAWLRVLADDKVKFLGRTVPGNAYAFSGTKHIELLTGNGSALQVVFNQKDLGILGANAEVVSLIFAKEGKEGNDVIMTPTPAFTATPTATARATITPPPTVTPQASPTITPLIP